MPAPTNKPLRYRQIHLDFHTSEHIPGVGAAFDPDDFVGDAQEGARRLDHHLRQVPSRLVLLPDQGRRAAPATSRAPISWATWSRR